MSVTRKDLERIISGKKFRLSELSRPGMWERFTKNMECGEERDFRQSCVDDEITICALTYILENDVELEFSEAKP